MFVLIVHEILSCTCSPNVHVHYFATSLKTHVHVSVVKLRGFIRSRQPAKIAACLVRIYLFPPPTLSVFSLKVLKKTHQFAA